jgi:hypothetical protein
MIRKSSDYLVFVDESGDHHLNKYPKNYPIFILAFVIISKDEYCDHLLPKFSRLKLNYFPDVSTIFHEREIRKAEKRFAFLTEDLYEIGVKHGLAKLEEFLQSQNDFNYTTVQVKNGSPSLA